MKFIFHRLWSWAAWLVFLLISPQPVNKSSSEMQLKINYAPISLGKLRIWSSVHHSLKSMKDLGMNKITGAIWMIILQNFLLAATDISVTYKSNGNTTLVRNTLMDLLWEKRFCQTRQISADNSSCWRGKMYVIKLYIIILSTDSIVQLVQKNLMFLVNLRIYWQGFGWCQRNFHRHKSLSSGSYLWNNSSPCKFYMIPLTPNISLEIFLTDCQIILIMLVWRIWYWIY